MRVICEKCRSAYAIEDAQVPASGARTECPRCNHVQLAKPVQKKGSTGMRQAVALSTGDVMDAAVQSAANVATSAPATQSETADRCKSCGVQLTDPFDQALGTCDACRSKPADVGPEVAPSKHPAPPPSQPARPQLLPELFDGHDHAEAHAPQHAPLEEIHAPRRKVVAANPRNVMSVAMTSNRSRMPRWVWGVSALGVLGLVGGIALTQGRLPLFASKTAEVHGAASTGPSKGAFERLKARHPKAAGNAVDLVTRGRTKLVDDRAESYDEARALFEEALVIDPHSSDAAWGLAESIALGAPQDAAARADALALLDTVPQTPRVKVGRAELLLDQGGEGADEKARALVQDALTTMNGEDAGFAHLALGRTYAHASANLALAAFDQALKESGRLVRTYTVRGVARANAGDYKGALADLQQRLALDPEHWPTLDALGRIDLEVGQVIRARQLYVRAREAAPSNLRPAIALAQVKYQAEGKPEEAVQLLQGILRAHSNLPPADLARVNAQLAAALRAAGELTRAYAAAQAALAAVPGEPAAHLQLLFLELAKNNPTAAESHLAPVTAALADRALAKVLEGRVLVAQGKFVEAAQAFREAANADPRRVDALLWAGAAYASANQREAAEPLLMRALQSDPTRSAPSELLTDLYVRPADLLRGAEGRVEKLANGDNDVMPRVFEALVRYHQHDLPNAERVLQRALAADDANALALSLRALVELAEGKVKPAQVDGRRAASIGRQVPLAHYAAGAALAAGGDDEAAKQELNQAHALAPAMAAADLKLAGIEARTTPKAARERLQQVLSLDPSYAEARHALFALEVE